MVGLDSVVGVLLGAVQGLRRQLVEHPQVAGCLVCVTFEDVPEETWTTARALGRGTGQGSSLGMPLPVADVAAWCAEHSILTAQRA